MKYVHWWQLGGTGVIDPGAVGSFHVEYKIKNGVDLKEIKKLAYDSTLVILDGVNIIKEFPLEKVIKTNDTTPLIED